MQSRRWFSTALATAALLAACGGSDPTTPFIVTEPADTTVGEGGTANFAVEAVSSDAMTTDWWRAGASTAVGSGDNLSVGPVTLYDDAAAFTAVATNAQGSTTSRAATLTVTPRQWSASPQASGVASEGSANEIVGVTDAQGNFVFAFYGPSATPGRSGIWAGRRTAAGSFSANQLSSTTDAASAAPMELRVAVDTNGTTIVAWRRRDVGLNNASEIYAAVQQWGAGPDVAPVRLSAQGDFAMEPDVAATGPGQFEVVWTEATLGNPQIRVVTRAFTLGGAPWAGPQTVAAVTGVNVTGPRIASDGAGRVWAAWSEYTQSNVYTVYGKERTAGASTWGGGAATALSAAGHSAPQMKMNANGQGVLTFSDSIGRVHARLLTPTGWAAAQYVANAHIVAPAVALHADGRIAIASLSVGTGQNTLYHWSYDPGNQAWSSASVVRATTGASIGAPSVRFDAAGNEVVLWSETQTGNGPVQVNARRFITGGMGWLAQAAVSPLVTGEAHTNPALAVAADGTSMALWYHVSNQGQSRVPVYALLR